MIKQVEQPFSLQDFARLLFQNRKQAGMYVLFFVIVSFNLCVFLPANMHTPAAGRMVNAFQLFCFAVMGVVNVWFFYKPKFLAAFSVSSARLAFICLLFIAIGLLLFIYYYVSGNNGLVMAFASSGAFLLPFLVYQGWTEYMNIPEKEYPVWRLPETAVPAGNAMPLPVANTLQVQLTIARRANDVHEHTFPVTTSGKLKLGKIFERFIEEQRIHGQQAAIETADRQQHAFGWQFYEKKWAGMYSRNLNPAMSLLENKIKPDAKITVKRICG
jgi:hypothetical protein